jgi:hypothetical protein
MHLRELNRSHLPLMAAASGFSGAVRLVGLDDHITPSQACVKPVQAAGGKGEHEQCWRFLDRSSRPI